MVDQKEEKKCIFCGIISGEIHSFKIYEDNKFIAILDIFPVTPGHTILMPKKHYESFFKIPDMDRIQLFETTKKIAEILTKTIDTDSFNLIVFEGKYSNKTITHDPHIHIIPRYPNDNLNLNPPRSRYVEGQIEQLHKKISKYFRGVNK